MSKPALTCYGGVGAVTGANFLLDTGAAQVLIDCGLLQGLPRAEATNADDFGYDPAAIEALFITHAHIDHVGRIPKLVKDGFHGPIYSTGPTREIATLMLLDMAHISEHDAAAEGKALIYDDADVEKAMSQWQTLDYHAPQYFGPPDNGYTVELYNAGHILGSAMYKFTLSTGRTILFTGDTGSAAAPIEDPIDPIGGLDYLLMDSVYGDRNHEAPAERDAAFRRTITEAIERGGTVLVPAFSLERTQVLLYELHKLFASGVVKSVPVFLDSPLAIKVTRIYEKFKADFNSDVESEVRQGADVFSFPTFVETLRSRNSREIELTKGPKIILAGSGMSTAGRILGHERTYLPDPNATLLIVGYQAPSTLGRQIQQGAKRVMIDGETVDVRARVISIDGFSAHRDSNHLVEFVSQTAKSLRRVFVTMGEPKSSMYLAQRLHDELDVEAIVPERAQSYELD